MISKLPDEVQSAFRTGITITSLSQCVLELVFNSLDANSSCIGVRVDIEKYQLQVVDNGCGIERDQLESVGQRYMTSKCSSLADLEGNAQYYGFRGEAIASIKDVCEALIVISKPEGLSTTFSKVMKGGEDVNNRVTKAMLNRPGNGTTVVVTNLFYNLPVRRRRMYNVIELEQLRQQMQAVALIHPKVSFTLRNDTTKSIVFNTKKCWNIIENFNQISGLDLPSESFVDVTHNDHPKFKINGFVCKKSFKSKKHQYIYINNRFVENKKLYAYFNQKLSRSFYFNALKMKNFGKGFHQNFNFDGIESTMENTSVCEYAIFILDIKCPYKEYDITLHPKKNLVEFKDWDEVLMCLFKCADKFIEHEKLLDSTILFKKEGACRIDEVTNITAHPDSFVKDSEHVVSSSKRMKVSDFEPNENMSGVVNTEKEAEANVAVKALDTNLNNESSSIIQVNVKVTPKTNEDEVNRDTNMKKNICRRKNYVENVCKENCHLTPKKVVKENCCLKRPLSRGHSEHVITECNFDFHTKSRKRIRVNETNVPDTNYFRTILPIVHSDIYETNLKALKSSLTYFHGTQVKRKSRQTYEKYSKHKFRMQIADSHKWNEPTKTLKTSNCKTQMENKVRQKKTVTFLNECSQNETHPRNPLDVHFNDKPENVSSNCKTKSIINLKKAENYCDHRNESLFRKQASLRFLDKNNMSASETMDCFSGKIFKEHDKKLHTNLHQNQSNATSDLFLSNENDGAELEDFKRTSSINLDDGSDARGNTAEDLFFANTALKKFPHPVDRGMNIATAQPSLENSLKLTSHNFKDLENNKFNRLNKLESQGCATHKRTSPSKSKEPPPRKRIHFDDECNIICNQAKVSPGRILQYGCSCFHALNTRCISNNENYINMKGDVNVSSCECVKKDMFTPPCSVTEAHSHDVASVRAINDGNKNENSAIFNQENLQDCSCEINEVLSFYKYKHHCPKNVHQKENLGKEENCIIERALTMRNFESLKNNIQTNNSQEINQKGSNHNHYSLKEIGLHNETNYNYQNVPSSSKHGIDIFFSGEDDTADLNNKRSDSYKLSHVPSNKDGKNEVKEFSFYFQPKKTTNLQIFDSFSDRSSNSSKDISEKLSDLTINTNYNQMDNNVYHQKPLKSPALSDNDCNLSHYSEYFNDNNGAFEVFDDLKYHGNESFNLSNKPDLNKSTNDKESDNKTYENDFPNSNNLNYCFTPDKNAPIVTNSTEEFAKNESAIFIDVSRVLNKKIESENDVKEHTENVSSSCSVSMFQNSDGKSSNNEISPSVDKNDRVSSQQLLNNSELSHLAKNQMVWSIFDVDVKYLVSKDKANSKFSVLKKTDNCIENVSKYSGSVCDNSMDALRQGSQHISEEVQNYFANATGYSLEYKENMTPEKPLEIPENEISKLHSDSKTYSLGSSFVNNLTLAYNIQLSPNSKLKAENILGSINPDQAIDKSTSDWVEQSLPSGLKIFIHRSSGMSSYVDPQVEALNRFHSVSRNPLLPKGMSPLLFISCDRTTEGLPDLSSDRKQNILDVAKEQKLSTSHEMEHNKNGEGERKNDVMSMTQLLMDDLSSNRGLEHIKIIQLPFQIASNSGLNCMFTKQHLENAEVIGLLDNRFIVTVINVSLSGTKRNVITLFDQHAVDERIRYESLLKDYKNDDGSFCTSAINPTVTITVDPNHMKLFEEFITKFEFLGLKFNVLNDTLIITSVPKCLLTRAEKETTNQCKELLVEVVNNLLQEQIETLLKTGGTVLTSPETLTSIIAYEACRGAIKFGDSISLSTALLLLKKLSKCQSPYQCAHGRPVLAPIIELPSV